MMISVSDTFFISDENEVQNIHMWQGQKPLYDYIIE